ncbi:charged multivesicular body protein 4b [Strongylocentrotus purpuratus]|uniref:POU-specific domain-containing protein n=1 Tax=Strongylocentrotus purpuratus TaxID=7668 RepID=A0A7M7THH1_STRPU|nr:charged multivesicular body protein 4b [Strongylocentrotus purpuratus]|eukprot:XP_798689.2 PREDICTED: charged multivesicular body protein 4b [Strongylocentrotus purpuratus]
MSGFLFGKKKKEVTVSPAEAIQKLRSTEEMLVKKQEFLEGKVSKELVIAKQNGTKNKRVAIQALKRKKKYEKQLAQVDGTLTTIEAQREALENANTNAEVLKNMKFASTALKTAHKEMGVEDVDDLMADVHEQMELATEISDAISNPIGFGADDIDEDELNAELEELEQEEFDEKMLDVDIELPQVPSASLPATKKKVAQDEDDDMRELEQWAM